MNVNEAKNRVKTTANKHTNHSIVSESRRGSTPVIQKTLMMAGKKGSLPSSFLNQIPPMLAAHHRPPMAKKLETIKRKTTISTDLKNSVIFKTVVDESANVNSLPTSQRGQFHIPALIATESIRKR